MHCHWATLWLRKTLREDDRDTVKKTQVKLLKRGIYGGWRKSVLLQGQVVSFMLPSSKVAQYVGFKQSQLPCHMNQKGMILAARGKAHTYNNNTLPPFESFLCQTQKKLHFLAAFNPQIFLRANTRTKILEDKLGYLVSMYTIFNDINLYRETNMSPFLNGKNYLKVFKSWETKGMFESVFIL